MTITSTTRMIEHTTWHYTCPDCDRVQSSQYEPCSDDDLRCHPCYLEKVKQNFDVHFAPLIGARMTEIISLDDPHFLQDARRLYLVDSTGQRWEVTSSEARLYVYRVDEDGKLVSEPKEKA